MNHCIYVLELKDNTTYIGYSANLEKRLIDHNSGKTKSIKNKLPAKLVYYEVYSNKTVALKRENQLKKNSSEKEKLYRRLFNK